MGHMIAFLSEHRFALPPVMDRIRSTSNIGSMEKQIPLVPMACFCLGMHVCITTLELQADIHLDRANSAAGADIILATPPSSGKSLIQYRMLGGTLDFYFFSGPDPKSVIEQYGEVVGKPTWQPLWAFGFHLCR